ncbi:uncharacterized protein UMAG_12214 [Mycosarcoma maydis]|uniref:Uncharacterized protein n=1 Tax=Mycosarcoma maydis TaxID=5270 RepID=A0A0D1DWR3_MYCMD|nr:uncharacterized protein UMAG_12214 [Ustilago maydis 521]KIS68629.1 hypothetical protein UMAG_12214 [Ustilago maydis 521]|eukprot:XP_011389851.1 hypothetical protein UMAG_12214 [Ustilago maydis 521]
MLAYLHERRMCAVAARLRTGALARVLQPRDCGEADSADFARRHGAERHGGYGYHRLHRCGVDATTAVASMSSTAKLAISRSQRRRSTSGSAETRRSGGAADAR